MSKNQWCLLDVDGVLLNWTDGIRRYAEKTHGIKPIKEKNNDWDFSKWLGISRESAIEISKDFFFSEDFSNLAPIKGAQEAVKHLHSSYKLAVVTSCSEEPQVVHSRDINLRKVFGNVFEKIIAVPWQEPKINYLKKFSPGQIFIDDKPQNIEDGINAGHQSIFFRQPHSNSYTIQEKYSGKYEEYSNWKDILRYINTL